MALRRRNASFLRLTLKYGAQEHETSSISWFHASKSEVSACSHVRLLATVSPFHLGTEVPKTLDTEDYLIPVYIPNSWYNGQ